MSGVEPTPPETGLAAQPFVTITPQDLEYAKHKFLSQVLKGESKLVAPANGMAGFLKRMGKG